MVTPLTEDDGYDLDELNYQLDRVKTAAFLGSNSAFLGPLMCGMDFVWTKDIPTAATDYTTIFWNPDDFLELDADLRKSTLLHELWHPGGLHNIRQGDRDPRDWNIACDYSINSNLKADGYKIEAPYFIYDARFHGMACEDIYDIIHQEKQCAPWGPGQAPGEASGSGDEAEGQMGGRNVGHDMMPALSPEQQQKALNNVIQAAHAAVAGKRAGDVPGHVQQLINKFLNPIVPWEILLDRFLEEKCREDYTWSKPNRRFQDIYLPSRESDDRLAHLIFYEDVSGSVTDDQCLRFNSEVKYIKEKYNPEKLTLVQFDTRITTEKTLTEDDPFDEVVIVGRGGTCLKEVREHMMKHNPTAAIVFSDLCVEPMEPGPKCPVFWVAIDNRTAKVPFGQLIHIKG